MTDSRPPSPDSTPSLPKNLEFVLGLSPSAMTLGLGNITALLDRLGNPHRRMRTAVVAGTNGKGSVVAMLASILRGEGLRTGRFTSPHVYSVTERVWVDGAVATLDEMEEAAARVAPLRDEIGYSYFEALTAIAFLVFAARGVDLAVMETGLGGRFDATNVTDPDVTVVTGVSVDHRRILGDTTEEILREKLGVTRPGVPLLIGDFSSSLRAHIDEKAEREGVPVAAPGDLGAVVTAGADGVRVRITTPVATYDGLTPPFPGAHQRTNMLLAVGAAERITGGALRHLQASLPAAYLPGRFERTERGRKTFIVDVAHNEAALCAAADELRTGGERQDNAVVLGLMRRKELFDAPRALLGAARRVYLVSPGPGGQQDPAHPPHELLARYVQPLLTELPTDAIVWNRSGPEDDHWARLLCALERDENPCRTILVTGSHHVVEHFGRRLRLPTKG